MKWKLLDEQSERRNVIDADKACCLMESEIRLLIEKNLKNRYKSDLTDALDMLEEVRKYYRSHKLDSFLNKFKN